MAFRPLESNPRIESRVLFSHQLTAVVNEHHALASRPSLTLEELQRYDLALPLRGTRARNAFERIIAGKGYHYKVKVEMNYVYLLFRLLRESNYVTILSESTVLGEQGLRAIPIIGMDTEENLMYGCIHLLRNVYQKKSAKEFISMLSESTSVLRQTFSFPL
jgi:LysR family cyn operon transcriptional activator